MKKSNLTAMAISLVLVSGVINTVSAKSIQAGGTALTCSSNADCKTKCEAKGSDHTWKPNPGGSTWGTCTKKKASLGRFNQHRLMTATPLGAHKMMKPQSSLLKPSHIKPKIVSIHSQATAPSKVIKRQGSIIGSRVKQPRNTGLMPKRIATPSLLKQQGIKRPNIRLVNPALKLKQTALKPMVGLKMPSLLKQRKMPVRNGMVVGGFVPATDTVVNTAVGLSGIIKTLPTGFIDKEVNIPIQVLADKVQAAFQDTRVRFNNYGPRHGNSWYKGNDSYVELPAQTGIPKYQFSFPAMNALPVRYYINDVNLNGVQINEQLGKLKVEFNFESNGTEIKGHCSNSYKCVLGNDTSVPDIQMNNAKAIILLTPAFYNGSVSFSQATVDFTANIQAQGGCDVIGLRSLCNLIDYKGTIKNSAKAAIKSTIDNPAIRNKIALEMSILLASQNVRNIQSVEVLGRMLVIKYRQMLGQNAIQR